MENKLEQQVLSEAELMERLGLTKKQLDHLRWQRGFPYVSLARTVRVYLINDVLEHIERQARQESWAQSVKAFQKEQKRGKAGESL